MAKALPHSKQVVQELHGYLEDVCREVASAATALGGSAAYRRVYKNSLAASVVMGQLSRGQLPLIRAARSITQRCPLLLASRQVSLGYVDLRRFVEMVVWLPYFREHPVEWRELLENPGQRFSRDPARPIAYCAHREVPWYLAYIREKLQMKSCAVIEESAQELGQAYSTLSAHVHAARSAAKGKGLHAPLDDISEVELREYERKQRQALRAGCITVAGAIPNGLAKLDAVGRAWFDWLIGKGKARQVRAGYFGLS